MSDLSHINAKGEASMVDVAGKAVTERVAIAEGFVVMERGTLRLIEEGDAPKGDVLAAARIAGIMAAKRTQDLIPLCHQLALSKVSVDFELSPETPGVRVEAMAKALGQTGVEMEALTAVAVASLTLYDMLKARDKAMRIEGIRLLSKTGGKSGDFHAQPIARAAHDLDAGGGRASAHRERRRASRLRTRLDLRCCGTRACRRPERKADTAAVPGLGHGWLRRPRRRYRFQPC